MLHAIHAPARSALVQRCAGGAINHREYGVSLRKRFTEMDQIDIVVGQRLRALRRARRLPLIELGRRVGVSYQQMQKYERGHNRISASQLWRLAAALNVEIGALFPDENNFKCEDVALGASLSRLDAHVRQCLDNSSKLLSAPNLAGMRSNKRHISVSYIAGLKI